MQVRLFPEDDRSTDRAVSPVIGVILMVAITVILAAVIGTFVLNLSGSVQGSVDGAVTVQPDSDVSDNATVSINSLGPDVKNISCIYTNGSLDEVGTSVGQQQSCLDGSNVVAFAKADSDKKDKTLQTNIDN